VVDTDISASIAQELTASLEETVVDDPNMDPTAATT
jgi:hypothetical protein